MNHALPFNLSIRLKCNASDVSGGKCGKGRETNGNTTTPPSFSNTRFTTAEALAHVAHIIASSPEQRLPIVHVMAKLWERLGEMPVTAADVEKVCGRICEAEIPKHWQTIGNVAPDVVTAAIRAGNCVIFRPGEDRTVFAVNPKIDCAWLMKMHQEAAILTPSSTPENSQHHSPVNGISGGTAFSHSTVLQNQGLEASDYFSMHTQVGSEADIEAAGIYDIPRWTSVNEYVAPRPKITQAAVSVSLAAEDDDINMSEDQPAWRGEWYEPEWLEVTSPRAA